MECIFKALRTVIVFVLVSLCGVSCESRNQNSSYFPAMFVFGDSTVDPGNNNVLSTIVKSNFPPYGKDFIGHIPTGRFSNGKLLSDILSTLVGLPETIPAFYDPHFKESKYLQGVSFASAASGYYYLTCKSANSLTLDQQVDNFKSHKIQLANTVGANEAETMIGESLFFLSTGAADFGLCYFCHLLLLPVCGYCTKLRQTYTVDEFVDLLVQSLSNFFERIVGEGARKVMVLGMVPLGCLPASITVHNLTSISRPCWDEMNEASKSFNAKAISFLQSMETSYPHVKVVYLNIYDKFFDMIVNPSTYGFEEVNKGCCGTGLTETTYLCNKLLPVCADASKYIFFDAIHPTETAASVIAREILEQIAQKSLI